LVLNAQRVNSQNRCFGAKPVTPGGTNLYLVGKALFFELFLKGSANLHCTIGPTSSSTDINTRLCPILLGEKLIPVPF